MFETPCYVPRVYYYSGASTYAVYDIRCSKSCKDQNRLSGELTRHINDRNKQCPHMSSFPLIFYIFFPKNNLHSHRDANYIHEYVQDFLTYSYTDSARNCSNIAHHKSTRGGWLQQKTWRLTYWLCLLIILVGKQVDILPVKKHFRNVKYWVERSLFNKSNQRLLYLKSCPIVS